MIARAEQKSALSLSKVDRVSLSVGERREYLLFEIAFSRISSHAYLLSQLAYNRITFSILELDSMRTQGDRIYHDQIDDRTLRRPDGRPDGSRGPDGRPDF